MEPASPPFRVLFLCTGNSARSQMAEAILNRKGGGRFVAESAGSDPAGSVNPYAIKALREAGIEWKGHQPHGLADMKSHHWDLVITVCDRARESCPLFPGQPMIAHWGMPDPASVAGQDDVKSAAFFDALNLINCRIDLLLALPVKKLERLVLNAQLKAIGETGLALGRSPVDRASDAAL